MGRSRTSYPSSQPSSCHAAHASSRSFRGIRIPSKKSSISALSNSSEQLFVSRPGIYTFTSRQVKMHLKIFFAENWDFIPKVAQEFTGRARCVNLWVENKNGRNLNFFTGVSEFASGPAAHPELQEIPASGSWELFWEFSGVFKEFRGVWICQLRTGRLAGTYPQVIHRFFCIREFGSLK